MASPGDFDPDFGRYGYGEGGKLSRVEALAPATSGVLALGERPAGTASLIRLKVDGSYDRAFGLVRLGAGIKPVDVVAAATGESWVLLGGGNGSSELVALTPSGELRSGFGGGDGRLPIALGAPERLRIDSQARLVVVGSDAVLRLDESGDPDGSFAAGGRLSPPAGTEFDDADLTAQDAILAAVADPQHGSVHLDRYLSDGSPDATFGGTGTVPLPLFDSAFEPVQVEVDPAGRIYVVGPYCDGLGPGCAWYMTRLKLDGSYEVDTSYSGGNGPQVTGAAFAPEEMGSVWAAGEFGLAEPFEGPYAPFSDAATRLDVRGHTIEGENALFYRRDKSVSIAEIELTPAGLLVGGSTEGDEESKGVVARLRIAPGRPDADGDGTKDATDACVRFAASGNHGCPVWGKRSLDLRLKGRTLIAQIHSKRERCAGDSLIRIQRRAKGGVFQTVHKARTRWRGDRVPYNLEKPGLYRARARAHVAGGVEWCPGAVDRLAVR